jgi:serine phosphatase RsbU (regulator of sigma subunit)
MFGKEAIYDLVRRNASAGAGQLLDTLLYAVTRFQKDQPPTDDITLAIIKVK